MDKFVTICSCQDLFSASLFGMGHSENLVQKATTLVDQKLFWSQNRALLRMARILYTGT
jgi:hypothetical protein